MNNSHRDQLSFNYSIWKVKGTNIYNLDKAIFNSDWFKINMHHKKNKQNKAITGQTQTVNTGIKQGLITIRKEAYNVKEKLSKRITVVNPTNKKRCFLKHSSTR